MHLTLIRQTFTERSTIGALYVNSRFECYTLEDPTHDGPKIPGATAIPYGEYEISFTFSPRFQRVLPILIGVPGFEGVRMHPGNRPEDTEGCILLGTAVAGPDCIANSRRACDALFPRIRAACLNEGCHITIRSNHAERSAIGAA